MQNTLALIVLAAASGAAAQGVAAGTLLPTAAAPAGCSASYNGKFEITVVQPSNTKRDLVEKRQSSCTDSGVLVAQLSNGVLTDAAGRIGGIVANRQFQFDGPPSQTGTIYNGGFSVCSNGSLAIGGNALFHQCLSGDFYNLYDQNVAAQCIPVLIEVIPCSGSGAAPATTAAAPATTSASSGGATQIGDGQIQASSAVRGPVTQIGDGQVQASSALPKPVSQYNDGQIQVTAWAPKATPVAQIPDGQVQASSATSKPAPVTQIGDGQIQATKPATLKTTATPVAQITDGQLQNSNATKPTTSAPAQFTGAANIASYGAEMMAAAVGVAAFALL